MRRTKAGIRALVAVGPNSSQMRWETLPRRQTFPLRSYLVGITVAALMAAIPCAFAKKKEVIEHAPLPATILAAKTVYIQNDSPFPEIADKAYTQLKKWGRFRVVDSKQKADLILLLTVTHSTSDRANRAFTSLYNSKTGGYTYGMVPSGTSTVRWSYTNLRIIDPKTQDVLWEDQRQWAKKSATEEVMKSLRSRIEEQEKETGR